MAQFFYPGPLSRKYQKALSLAFEWHCLGSKGFQMRKDGSPYIAHPLAVSTLVLENGGTEDEGIAGLVHDAIEDVQISPELISAEFGEEIAQIVIEVTEPKQGKWRDRKLTYINQIRNGSRSAVLVSLADKTHNGMAYLKGARIGAKDGSQSKTEETLWFLRELTSVYKDRMPGEYLVEVLELCLKELSVRWNENPDQISEQATSKPG